MYIDNTCKICHNKQEIINKGFAVDVCLLSDNSNTKFWTAKSVGNVCTSITIIDRDRSDPRHAHLWRFLRTRILNGWSDFPIFSQTTPL